ncbi:MAG: hypothetical protein ACJ8D5_02510 [Sphingomicrobium sp.]
MDSIAPDEIPDFATLAADPEIAPLLEFEPVPRKVKRPDGWTDELQRELIARLAATGTLQRAVWQMGKHATGAEALYKTPSADSFRAAWDAALALGRRRNGFDAAPPFLGEVPGITRRARPSRPEPAVRLPGQILNEYGEWEDEDAIQRRAEETRDAISNRLLRLRRLYLHEISDSPGKRAAFEILTELPIDWGRAERLEPQPDEPWRCPRMSNPDLLLTAENGWMGGFVHGPDKLAELREAMDEYRAEEGLPPVDWDAEAPPQQAND